MNWPPYIRTSNVNGLFDAVELSLARTTFWRVRERKEDSEVKYITADYVGNGFSGTDLAFALCSFKDEPFQVQLTMHAVRWCDDSSFPTDDESLETESWLKPIWSDARKTLGTSIRLSRPRS